MSLEDRLDLGVDGPLSHVLVLLGAVVDADHPPSLLQGVHGAQDRLVLLPRVHGFELLARAVLQLGQGHHLLLAVVDDVVRHPHIERVVATQIILVRVAQRGDQVGADEPDGLAHRLEAHTGIVGVVHDVPEQHDAPEQTLDLAKRSHVPVARAHDALVALGLLVPRLEVIKGLRGLGCQRVHQRRQGIDRADHLLILRLGRHE